MTKPFLILLVFELYDVCSICYVKEKTVERNQENDRPKAVDEYHCKILCAESKECVSFGFIKNHCKHYGSRKIGSASDLGVAQWVFVKKTSDSNCQDKIKQPLITEGYAPNPEIEYLTELDEFEMTFNTWQPCQKGWILEVILSGKNHRLEGDHFNHIHWNGKIGSWILTKKTEQSNTNTTTYIRAARCFLIMPELFGDPKSCGGSLPAMAATGEFLGKPPKGFGGYFSCAGFQFVTYFDSRVKTVHNFDHTLVCIDGSWIYLKRSSSKEIINAWKLLNGACL
ncbi:hypothetical protein PRIPAC_88275 [Pristionchus pacificus]|nr:hypothetical protein PRIPAC_88275 [Pristionchus pacificus]